MLEAGFIKFHQLFQKLLVIGGGGGDGGHSNSAFYSVKLCVMVNFSLHHNVLCLSFVIVLYSTIACIQLLKWFSLMKMVVMRNKNLKVHSRSTDHYSLLKHRKFSLCPFSRWEGDTYLESDF